MLCSFAITKGVYFYEIEILKNLGKESIQTGWITKFAELHRINDPDYSDTSHVMFFYKKKARRGDIIGCFVNIEQQNINFYYNRKLVLVQDISKIIKNLPIFAFTVTQVGQNVRFNFGDRAFKYPLNEHYETFHSEIIKKLPTFQIKIKNKIEWFCSLYDYSSSEILNYSDFNTENDYSDYNTKNLHVFDYSQNNLEIFFRFNDSIQKQFNEKIVDIENMINDNKNFEQIATYVYSFLFNLNDDLTCLYYRLFQSIVESIGYKINNNKINMLDECICFILNNVSDYFEKYVFHYKNITFCFSKNHHFFVNYIFIFSKTVDFQNNDYENQTKIHYICLILCYFFKNNICCDYIKEQCELFFYLVLDHSTNHWCQFYAIKSLDNHYKESKIKLKQYLLSAIEKKEKPPFLIWRNSFNNQNDLKNTRVKENSSKLQLYQYLQHYLPKTSQTTNDNAFKQDFDFEVTTKEDFIFSFFNLMIRSNNSLHKTIRYKFSISPPSFYFETTIITIGSMTVGLAVKQMDIRNYVGMNALSIGINGYNRCVYMHNKKYKFKNSRPQWNAGDVVGIYVDLVNRSVIFGINNKIIELDGDPFEEEFIFSILPCHVAASLTEYQQCFFNFDCTVIPQAFLNKQESINQNIQNVHNSVLMCGSTATAGNIAINGN